jgi:TolA-binding protein
VTMRRALPYLVALLLGAGAALLAACGESTRGGIPSAQASELKSEIEDVQQALDGERCDDLPGQLRQVDGAIDELPESVDDRIVSALSDGADRLRRNATEECDREQTETQTETQTEPEPATQTQAPPPPPPPTQTQAPTPTQTQPPPTATAAPPPAAPPPAPDDPGNANPPANPGGGTPPEVPPG